MRRPPMHPGWPRSEDLAFEPELAPLALLEAALLLSSQSLIARNPEMLLGEELLRQPPLAVAARNVILLSGEMHQALDDYRALLPPAHDPDPTDDIPF
jgi:hypothetical protein